MIKPTERQDDAEDPQRSWNDISDEESSFDSPDNEVSRDKQKFKHLKESKRRFLHELNESPVEGDMKQRLDILVKKAESLANFLLTKHKYKE